jgi:hypothetical protein
MSELTRWSLLGGAFLVGLIFAGCSLTRAGYESPKYALKAKLGRVEIREYPDLVLAETPSRHASEGRDGSFVRLFRYISKGNSGGQALPMTTPVFYRGAGETQSMAFVMKPGVPMEKVPAPLDGAVRINKREAGSFAVMRMRGGRVRQAQQEAVEAVRGALKDSGWRLEGDPEFAFYDPPWIPSFLEKNELVWRVSHR